MSLAVLLLLGRRSPPAPARRCPRSSQVCDPAASMEQSLTGTVALVTGASSGIGEAAAAALAAAGASVALVARRRDRLDGLAARIRDEGGTALVLDAHITDQAAANEVVQRTMEAAGRLH